MAASSAVINAGMTIATVLTRAARPTIALGLRRIVLKAPSKKSPSRSGRSATTPGLWTGVAHGGAPYGWPYGPG